MSIVIEAIKLMIVMLSPLSDKIKPLWRKNHSKLACHLKTIVTGLGNLSKELEDIPLLKEERLINLNFEDQFYSIRIGFRAFKNVHLLTAS